MNLRSGAQDCNSWSSRALEPVLCNNKRHHNEKPSNCNKNLLSPQGEREKPVQQQRPNAAKSKINKLQKKRKECLHCLQSNGDAGHVCFWNRLSCVGMLWNSDSWKYHASRLICEATLADLMTRWSQSRRGSFTLLPICFSWSLAVCWEGELSLCFLQQHGVSLRHDKSRNSEST